MKKGHTWLWLLLLALLFVLSLTTGSSRSTPAEIIRALRSPDDPLRYIVLELRLPRTLSALLCGAVLGISGAVFQAVLKNPMADPYVLGISSGGSLERQSERVSERSPDRAGARRRAFASLLILLLSPSPKPDTADPLRRRDKLPVFIVADTRHASCPRTVPADHVLDAWFVFRRFVPADSCGACSVSRLVPSVAFFTNQLDMMLLDTSSALSLGLDIKRFRVVFILLPTLSVSVCVASYGVIGFVDFLHLTSRES